MHQTTPIHKLYYIAPMFRYERAQAGRYRQHHQFGAEAIGSGAPEQDVELIDMLHTLYIRLGLKNLSVTINSIGNPPERLLFRKALQEYFRNHIDLLSSDSKQRLEINPLRILDSKDPKDKEIAANAPSILDFLVSECQDHFAQVQKLLTQLKIPFSVNAGLVRGLDYYNRTVFEIVAGELGAQNSIAGGGRYDGLLKTLGGPDLPAAGFGTGIERILQTLLKQAAPLPGPYAPTVFLIAMGDKSKAACFELLHQIRSQGIAAQMDFGSKKLGKLMQYANQIGAKNVVVIGDNELESNEIEIKEMESGTTRKAALSELPYVI